MKKFFTLSMAILSFPASFSQIQSGFYRVKNADTRRYVYVYDNEGYARLDGMQVRTDLDAIYLRAELSNAISDPGSIIFVEKIGSEYDLQSQGTGVHQILDHYVTLSARNGHYSVGATVSGVSAYLADSKGSSTTGYGKISIDSSGKRLWDPIPVDASTDNYFGVAPSLKCGETYYTSLFTEFGYTPISESTKIYYVSSISDKGAVLVNEIEGDVPNTTPVIIESISSSAANNKLQPKKVSSSIKENALRGVYFDTDNSDKTFAKDIHINQKSVTGKMRMLGVTSDGKLAFMKSSLKTVPANSAYLEVDSDSYPDNLIVCFTMDEYLKYEPNPQGLDEVTTATSSQIYDLLGKKVQQKDALPSGIYIINGKKTIIR